MHEVPQGAVVRLPGDAETVQMGGFNVIFHAGQRDTQGAFSLLETREQAAAAGPPLHVHRDAAESFLVLAGEYVMHLDGREFRCPPGSFIYVPLGMPHTFRVTATGSRKLNLYTPAAMEGYFRELSAALRDGVDDAGLADIAECYSMDLVGPVPKGYL
jgi:mannose-6-phosphate isomerase-like protein (cupin superfamily)